MKRAMVAIGVLLVPAMAWGQQAVDLNTAKFQWDWTQGTGGAATEFRIKCGPTAGNYPTVVPVPPTIRQYPINQVIGGSGTYFCVITAANQVGESAPSGEVFFAAGVTPSIPSNLRVTP